jgi:CPA2 family monovalent cation:H+ antiporter-2
MPAHTLLSDLVLTYAIGLVFIVGLARIRIPAIVALMLAGIAAGPWALKIVSTPEEVEALAEIGIVLLLFTVGLDFSLTAMRQIWRTVVFAGTLQMFGTVAAVAALATALMASGSSVQLAVFIGLFVALSSTAIVLQALGARNELGAPHGRLTVGILLLQDLAIVVLLLLVPILSGQTSLSAIPMAIGRAVLAIAVVAGASRLVLPALLRLVTASGRREAFPLAILLASVGSAWLSTLVGLSMAVGAFLAGLMLAESEFHHQAYAEIRPVRDLLSGLFFISLGMLLDVPGVLSQLHTVLLIAGLIISVKAIVATGALIGTATPLRIAVISGICLAQVGEFSFIVGRAGLDSKLLPPDMWQVLLGASILTMVLTPPLISAAPAIAARLRRSGPAPAGDEGIPALSGHVIVFGFGVGGQLVARAMREIGVPYLILELNGATVRRMRAEGERIFYGDATSPESLHAAGITSASAIVCLLSDPDAALRMVSTAHDMAPGLPIIVRTRYRTEAERLQRMGAVAVAEELEASLEVLAQLLSRLQVAGNIIEALLDVFRRESVALRPLRAPRSTPEALPEALGHLPVATHRLEPGHWAIGHTLAETNLRADTGATVLAIQRGTEYAAVLTPDRRLEEGDVLYVVGDDSDVLLARTRLMNGPT